MSGRWRLGLGASMLGSGMMLLACEVVAAQPFGSGPPGSVVGSSRASPELRGRPELQSPRIPNAPVFGDTVEERRFGRDVDDSFLRPEVRRPANRLTIEERARAGRSRLDTGRAGVYARSGPLAIGSSPVTRGALGARQPSVGLPRR